IRLARQLDGLPAVRDAMVSGELGYTKAREIVGVATPDTQDEWLQAAKKPRKELVREVKRVKQAAKVDPGQTELLPTAPTVVAPKELPVRFQMDLTPEQEARRAALVEQLHKLGGIPNDKAELVLEALAALVETKEKAPRGTLAGRPPVQIHVHEEAGKMTVETDVGKRELSRAEAERMKCDAAICEHGGRNTTTIPPRVRRQVLARDRHRCQSPGCKRTRFLEVHHIVPRSRGGENDPENLTTLCGSCHRLWHERGIGVTVEESDIISS
ncbi:MAG: HNH endonuclease, partial [Candidatus Krumholzibacteriota bacterium]